jgi:AhpD family alkylhydroperoxidase
MATHARDYYDNNAAAMKPVRERAGETIKAFGAMHHGIMKDGAVDLKTKELIALSIGLAVRCENCIYAHVAAARKAGASDEEILEAAGVAIMMGGGPVYTYLPRVTEALAALDETA